MGLESKTIDERIAEIQTGLRELSARVDRMSEAADAEDLAAIASARDEPGESLEIARTRLADCPQFRALLDACGYDVSPNDNVRDSSIG